MNRASESNRVVVIEMMHTLKKAKNHLHSINRFLMVKGNTPWNSVRIQVEKLWGALHTYRLNTERSSETEQLLLAIDKAAGQASRLHDVLLCSESDKVTNEFMVLRKYVELVEKGMVRYWHWVETGVRAKEIGTIGWASTLSGKSEITIRRYIRADRIRAYQMSKKWWIPREEVDAVGKGDRQNGE